MKNLFKKVAVVATVTAMAVSTSAFAAGVSNATLSADRKTVTFTGTSDGTMTYVIYSAGNEALEDTDTIYGIDQLDEDGQVTVKMPSSFVGDSVMLKVGGDGRPQTMKVEGIMLDPTIESEVDNTPIEVEGETIPRTFVVRSTVTPNNYAISNVKTKFAPVKNDVANDAIAVEADFALTGNISGEGSYEYIAVLQAPTQASGYNVKATTTATVVDSEAITDVVTGTIQN